MDDGSSRSIVRRLVTGVDPYDEREAADQAWMLDWIGSGVELFRLKRPATPSEHLAVYAALLDEESRSVMLVDHVKARAWLLPGGHVDPGEDPRVTVVRELGEELRITPSFHPRLGDAPFFLSVTQTRPPDSHTDVTMWFVFTTSRDTPIVPDPAEFSAVRWFGLDEPAAWAGEQLDPQMYRFVAKLAAALEPAISH
jgi:8-oxo-dGTP diphosphatase